MWRACLLLLALVAGTRQLTITQFVVPTTVEAGQNATLQCEYNLTADEPPNFLFVKWWWTPMNESSDQRTQLYQRIAGRDATAIPENIEVDDNDSIILINATPADSGTYECEVSNVEEVRKHQDLVVFNIGSGPELNVTVVADGPDDDDVDDVLVTCSAIDVAPYPILQISVQGKIMSKSDDVIGPTNGFYSVYENATISKDQANDAEIRCELFFENAVIPGEPYTDTELFVDPTAPAAAADAHAAGRVRELAAPPGQPPSQSSCEKFGATRMLLIPLSYIVFHFI